MTIGPIVKLDVSCYECTHCKTERYTCQGDSGTDVYCEKVTDERGLMRRVGDSSWRTPEWCPFLAGAIGEKMRSLSGSIK
jgi:hypothetical protein